MKRKLEEQPDWSARQAYNWQMNQLPVDEAALATPLTSVERSLQRFKVANRPPLPATRQDLMLGNNQTVTNDGRRFLLIDDGQADRIVVFCTDNNLERYTGDNLCIPLSILKLFNYITNTL